MWNQRKCVIGGFEWFSQPFKERANKSIIINLDRSLYDSQLKDLSEPKTI